MAVILLLLHGALLVQAHAEPQKDPPIIDTGIIGSGACWYDTERLIIVKRSPFKAGQESEVEGLYVLTPTKPREATKIDLFPVEPELQKWIWDVRCHDGTIVFSVPTPDKKRSRLYGVKIGGRPELLVEMRGAMSQNMSMKGKYVLAYKHMRGNKGVYEDEDNCVIQFIKPEFKVHCVDARAALRRWPLANFVLAEYQWSDTIKVPGPDGQPKVVPNPETQLTDKDGKPINYAMFLRDFKGATLVNILEDPVFAPWITDGFVFTADESFMYSACSVRNNPIGLADGVCRRRLAAGLQLWEEVFRSEIPRKHKASISNVKVSPTGDLYFIIGGTKAPYHGVWKYSTQTKQVTQLTNPGNFYDNPTAISPNGRWVAFSRTGTVGNSAFLVQGGEK